MGFVREAMAVLVVMFVLSICVYIISVLFGYHLTPVIVNALPGGEVGASAESGIYFVKNMISYVPYILMGVLVVFMLLLSVKKEPIEREY